MALTHIVEAYLIASEDPLSSEAIVGLIQRRIADADAAIAKALAELDADAPESDRPRLSADLSDLKKTTAEDIDSAIETLNTAYEQNERSFRILPRAKGWKIFTTPAFSPFVSQLFPERKKKRLSPPATETLAIIAYRQPVSKSAIDAVRGVSSDGMLQKLLDLELIHVSGRADLPGRPLLYSTTDLFFEHFGVSSIDELPNSGELRRVSLPSAPEEAGESTAEQLTLADQPSATENGENLANS